MTKHVMSAAMLAAASAPLNGFTRSAPRALLGPVRSEVPVEIKAMMDALTKGVTDMRSEFETSLKAKSDVVAIEKIEKLNAEITKRQDTLTAALDEFSVKMQALSILADGKENEKIFGDLPASPKAMHEAMRVYMRHGVDDARFTNEVKAALTKGTDADGGYTAPIEWDRTLIQKLKQISKIRENAKVQAISTAGFKKLYGDRAVGSGWVGETASRPATSTPQFAMLDFTPGEIYANPAISMQLLQDSALDLETWLAGEVETEFARQEGIAFLSGDGVNKPYGILTYVLGAANAARHPWGAIDVQNSGNANLMTSDGILDLVYGLRAEFAENSKFYFNRTSQGALRKLKDGQGNYLWNQNYAAGQPSTLVGYPIVDIPGMPNVAANAIVALFGDMMATYMVIDRIGINVLRDPFTNKPFIHFYTTKRVGGGVFNPEPMRALKISA